ncbi:MAG TPA: OmpA family protein [Blastocatellia bacterium]|nr:OmpA family protein [Blastocatellia bacterium]
MKTASKMLVLGVLVAIGSSGCATRKYARERVNERVTPLEQRTGELEETSRRNSQDIGKLNNDVTDVRNKVGQAQSQADNAMAKAAQANTRVDSAQQSVNDLRNNLDKYSLESTAVVNFKFDSYELTPDARASLDNLASQIKSRDNFVLEIEGFADYIGSDQYNYQLTQKRAEAVEGYLAAQHAIPVYRMFILGFGKSRPVADNSSREGRAQNRRVEVRLMLRALSPNSTAQSGSSNSH